MVFECSEKNQKSFFCVCVWNIVVVVLVEDNARSPKNKKDLETLVIFVYKKFFSFHQYINSNYLHNEKRSNWHNYLRRVDLSWTDGSSDLWEKATKKGSSQKRAFLPVKFVWSSSSRTTAPLFNSFLEVEKVKKQNGHFFRLWISMWQEKGGRAFSL